MNPLSGIPSAINQGMSDTTDIQSFERFCISATNALSDALRSCFGPASSNKLIINHLEVEHLTFSASSIFSQLNISNPICRLIERCVKHMETSSGSSECSTYFVLLVCELLKVCLFLMKEGVEKKKIFVAIKTFLRNCKESMKRKMINFPTFFENESKDDFNLNNKEYEKIREIYKGTFLSSISSKLFYRKRFFLNCFFPRLPSLPSSNFSKNSNKVIHHSDKREEEINYDSFFKAIYKNELKSENFMIVRKTGVSVSDSFLLEGLVLSSSFLVPSKSNFQFRKKVKVIVFSCSIDLMETDSKGIVLLSSAEELLSYTKTEENLLEEKIDRLCSEGVKLIFSGGSVSALVLQMLEKRGMNAVCLSSKFELRKVADVASVEILTQFDVPSLSSSSPSSYEKDKIDCVEGERERKRIGEIEVEEMGIGNCFEKNMVLIRSCSSSEKTLKEFKFERKNKYFTFVVVSPIDLLSSKIDIVINKAVCNLIAVAKAGKVLNGGGSLEEEILREFKDKGIEFEFGGKKEFVYEEIINVIETMKEKIVKSRNRELSTNSLYDSAENKVKVFELAEEVVDSCLIVDNIYFGKPSGGPDVMDNFGGHWDERDEVNY